MTKNIAQFFARHQGSLLKFVLSLIIVLFIAIIFTVYFVARRANPIFLDEHGQPVNAQTVERPANVY